NWKKVKLPAVWTTPPRVVVTALFIASLAGCAQPRARTAPFRVRPDAVGAGKLVGPFDGRVVDGASGDPVAGAIVYATWTFQAGYGLTSPAGYHEEIATTDADGRYRIRSLRDVPRDRRKYRAVADWRD